MSVVAALQWHAANLFYSGPKFWLISNVTSKVLINLQKYLLKMVLKFHVKVWKLQQLENEKKKYLEIKLFCFFLLWR